MDLAIRLTTTHEHLHTHTSVKNHQPIVTHLGRAADGASWQRRTQCIPTRQALPKLARDGTADMHHMAVSFHIHQPVNAHTAPVGDLAYVVATQVDQHHMFSQLLGIRQKILLKSLVRLWGAASPPSSSQWPGTLQVICHIISHNQQATWVACGKCCCHAWSSWVVCDSLVECFVIRWWSVV